MALPLFATFSRSMRPGSSSSEHQPKADALPKYVTVVVEVPQGSFVKRRPDGSVDFITPLPSPFNYGSVPDVPAPDGDPLDAVILGRHLPYGHTGVWRVRGCVRFVDDGVVDNKLICTQHRPSTNLAPTSMRLGRPAAPANARSRTSSVGSASGPAGRTTRGPAGRTARGPASRTARGPAGRTACVPAGLTPLDCLSLSAFFTVYAGFKTVLNAVRGKFGRTAFEGLDFSCVRVDL